MPATAAGIRRWDLTNLPSIRGQERDAGHDEPQRPGDVGDRGQSFGELPAAALVAADELQRAEHEDRPDDAAEAADPGRGGGGLRQGCAGEGGPCAGERVAEVLADRDAEVAVEGLKDDVDGLATGLAGVGLGGGAGEVRDEERPAHEAEEL